MKKKISRHKFVIGLRGEPTPISSSLWEPGDGSPIRIPGESKERDVEAGAHTAFAACEGRVNLGPKKKIQRGGCPSKWGSMKGVGRLQGAERRGLRIFFLKGEEFPFQSNKSSRKKKRNWGKKSRIQLQDTSKKTDDRRGT